MARAPGPNGIAHFSGLESEIYNIPFGLVSINCTAAGQFTSADMFETCYLISAGTPKQVGNAVMIDGGSIFVTRLMPLINSNGTALTLTTMDSVPFFNSPSALNSYTPPST